MTRDASAGAFKALISEKRTYFCAVFTTKIKVADIKKNAIIKNVKRRSFFSFDSKMEISGFFILAYNVDVEDNCVIICFDSNL